MKKLFALLLALCMAWSLVGCAQPAKEPDAGTESSAAPVETEAVTAVTGSGTAKGFGGDVTVTLTIQDGKILAAEAVGDGETAGVGAAAIEKLAAQAVEKNRIDLDAVTGATVSSGAFCEAAALALKAAGVNAEDLVAAEEAEAQTIQMTTDLLVIGAGAGGLTVANRAVELGVKDAIVLEKALSVGGASSQASGIAAGCSRLQTELGMTGDSADLIYDDIMRGGYQSNNPVLARLLADNMGSTLDWLIDNMNVPIESRYPGDFPEHTVQRFFLVTGGSTVMTDKLAENFVAAGGKLLLETRAYELLCDESGAVTGALATDADGNTLSITAKKTVIATGGFGNNPEMLTGNLSNYVFYGVGTSTGDGHKMAEAVGAKMINMEYAKLYPQGVFMPGTNSGKAVATQSIPLMSQTGAIYVNWEGKRVCDETLDFASIKHAMQEQTDEMVFIVMDQAAYDLWSKLCNDYVGAAAGRITYEEQEAWFEAKSDHPIFCRGTLEEAAAESGLDAAALRETLEHWNAMVQAGTDDDFGRKALHPFETDGTVYIVEQRLRYATTLGGMDVTEKLEVLDENDQPIPNLYAVGECTSGANGIEAMPGCMLSWALNSGRIAGETLAEVLK